MEIVPAATSSSPSAAAFAQQGTIDWTTLSTSSFSATLSILGRLSAEGLEPLTVAVAQAMFVQVPIGAHGEGVLQQAMSTLKSFSSFGDVVWFGFGVRHILRVLVQSSQGAASVALAACLTESHSTEFGARVFFEMAQLLGSPAELSPSFAQWNRYVEVCSHIFIHAHFGERVSQLARLAGFVVPITDSELQSMVATQPRHLAEVIVALGQVTAGRLEAITVHGGIQGCWLVVFADFLLGLRVRATKVDSTDVFQNYDASSEQAQVMVHLARSPSSGIIHRGQTFVVDSMDFVDRWYAEGHKGLGFLVDLRVPLSELIRFCFDFPTDPAVASHRAEILSLCALAYAKDTHSRYSTPESFVATVVRILPELKALEAVALERILQLGSESSSGDYPLISIEEFLVQKWIELRIAVQSSCACTYHGKRKCETFNAYATPIVLAYVLGEVVCDEAMPISRLGVDRLCQQLMDDRRSVRNFDRLRTFLLIADPYFQDTKPDHEGTLPPTFITYFNIVLTLYSGFAPPSATVDPRVSALSAHGLYCYVDYLRQPMSSYADASRIHIGRGSISAKSRKYTFIVDQAVDRLIPLPAALRPDTDMNGDDPTRIRTPRVPQYPEVRALVEENITLRFWFERSGQWPPDDSYKYSENPMESLYAGWTGDEGHWPGLHLRSLPHPRTYHVPVRIERSFQGSRR